MSNEKGHFSPTNKDNWTSQSGPPSKVVPNIPVGPNQNGLFNFDFLPKFQNWKVPCL